MATKRIYELAREMEMTSKELVAKLQEIGLSVKNHMSTVPVTEVERIKKMVYNLDREEKVKPKTAEQPKQNVRRGKSQKPQSRTKKQAARGRKKRKPQSSVKKQAPVRVKEIILEGPLTVQEFAHCLNRKAGEVIKKLISMGVMVTINQELDIDTLILLGEEFGTNVKVKATKEELLFSEVTDSPEDLAIRPPVITIMGHVDHGKTSLLDAIRQTEVTATEAGGITQHIGAYQVKINDKKITFLDTPGHEAFTAMRARGAQITDIVILVVAADDGVMPQTVEAIKHSQAAKLPIIIAITKMDKTAANPERIKQALTEYNLVPEEWGGETIYCHVSARTKEGITNLLEMILLLAELSELKANPHKAAVGTIIEAELDKGRGPVATVLVQEGILMVGDYIIVGTAHGRVRAMQDDKGQRLERALPSTPVEIIGLSAVPQAGDAFHVVKDEHLAKEIINERTMEEREKTMQAASRVSLDDLFAQIKEGEVQELNIIIKGDVHGSIEALKHSLENLSTNEVRVNIIHQAVGGISETDVMLATASNAIIIGFNVRPDANARRVIEEQKVDVRLYRVIYEAIEDVKAAMSGLLQPEIKEEIIGKGEVRAVIKVPKVGFIAGSYISEGKIIRNSQVRVIRDEIVIHEGKISSLRRFKDDIREVSSGFECGLALENYYDFQEGDQLEFFMLKEVKREIS